MNFKKFHLQQVAGWASFIWLSVQFQHCWWALHCFKWIYFLRQLL